MDSAPIAFPLGDALVRHPRAEWLEADGLGGFATGTVAGIRTRRYHGLLTVATTPLAGRVLLVAGFDAWVTTPRGVHPITSQYYAPDVAHPDGASRIEAFEPEPWPSWRFRLDDGLVIEHELFVVHGAPVVVVMWRLQNRHREARLFVRPFLAGRDIHQLHHENSSFRFEAERAGQVVSWRPYAGLPGITVCSNAGYRHEPLWYRNFLYQEERAWGLDFIEDLAAPGVFEWNLSQDEAAWIATTEAMSADLQAAGEPARQCAERLRAREARRRRRFPSRLHRAADAYLVARGRGKTIIAGYPWMADRARDTSIAVRGLCLATGRFDAAREVLRELAATALESHTVEASLWFIIAAGEYLQAIRRAVRSRAVGAQAALRPAIDAILEACAAGARPGIRLDDDGLLACGKPDVTLRIGKPIEVQALWINALAIAAAWSAVSKKRCARARRAFGERFWWEPRGMLADVVDADHEPGRIDAACRPNQIFAVGGLPLSLLDDERARCVVDTLEARLLTPWGLRTLAPDEPGYQPRCAVWPWLMGPFVEAWIRVRGSTARARQEARVRFVDPLMKQLDEMGIGHLPELADGEAPHTPRGCPFYAASVAEALRLELTVLSTTAARSTRRCSGMRRLGAT